MKKLLFTLLQCFLLSVAFSQGVWTAITATAPHANNGGMLLLSDGTILCKSSFGTADGVGNTYDRLTPNATGSYTGGTWSSIAPMISTRLYYSSQVLKDGRVYVAGGEYGTGIASGEVYNPINNTWTATPAPGVTISDANSEILEDGRVLQAHLTGGLTGTLIYNPATNTYTTGPTALGIHNESAWIKLPDNSVLYVNRLNTSSERYIPATNTWIADATVPVQLYDAFGLETGGALLLPDGRALFLGSSGHNAYYTPSGSTAPGTWAAAPDFPSAKGTPDAPAAMMVNGKVLCNASPIPTSANHFPTPTTFYEFDPVANVFTAVTAPGGGASLNISCYVTNLLCLPDGRILYGVQGSSQYYVYTPSGSPIAAGKPTISSVLLISGNNYQVNGTLFNGISQGATYGDDWQMNSNYPLVRLVSGTNVYYCRTSNWNSTGVSRGTAADNATFTVPANVPAGTYSLYVVANGFASDPVSFTVSAVACAAPAGLISSAITATGATVSWGAVSGAVSYAVDYKAATSATWISAATATTATSVNITGLTAGTLYDWRVRTNCASAASANTQSQFTTAVVTVCPGPLDVSTNGTAAGAAAIPFNTDVKGTISPTGDNDYYKFVISTGGTATITLTTLPGDYDVKLYSSNGTTQLAISQNGSTTSETISRTYTAGTYYVHVYGFNGANSAVNCYTLRVQLGTAAIAGGGSAIDDRIVADANGSLQLYPNPVVDYININVPGNISGPLTASIIDAKGVMVQTFILSSNKQRVDIAKLTSGIYMLRVTNGKDNLFSKFMKQ